MTANEPLYRRYVRESCALAQGYGLTEQALKDAIGMRVPGGRADLSTLRRAIEWNLGKDYIRSRRNEDTDENEWIITQDGLAKEELK